MINHKPNNHIPNGIFLRLKENKTPHKHWSGHFGFLSSMFSDRLNHNFSLFLNKKVSMDDATMRHG